MSKTPHIDLLNLLLANVKGGLSYMEQLKDLLKYYTDVDKSGKTSGNSLVVLCFLNYLAGEYDSVLQYKNKYKSNKCNLSSEEWTNLFAIPRKFNNDPYSDVYTFAMVFYQSNSMEVNRVLQAFLIVYEKEQAHFISKFYSTIKLSTLKSLVGTLYQDTKLVEYISRNGWTKASDAVTIKELPAIFEVNEFKNNLEFVNSMTVLLENNMKANSSLNTFI